MKGVIRGHGDKRTFFIDGKEVSQEEFDETFPDNPIGDGSGLIGWKPLVSDAMAVHPKQVQEAIADAKRKGVPVEFQPDGRPIFRDRAQRKAYMKAYGFFDKAGGYGDVSPGTFKDAPDAVDPVKELCEDLGARVTDKGREQMIREIMTGRRE